MKKCIVNYITLNAWHPYGQMRLKKSLKMYNFDGDVLFYNNQSFKCTTHQETPYGFKLFVMKDAQLKGYDIVLWVDASFWAIRNISVLFDIIEQKGIVVQDSGYVMGQWSSDKSLQYLGVGREEAFEHRMYSGGFVGLDLRQPKVKAFFEEFYQEAKIGTGFRGDWVNKNNKVSNDPRVKGHRHDMIVGTHLLHKHNLEMAGNNTYFSYYAWWEKYKRDVYFVCEGGTRVI